MSNMKFKSWTDSRQTEAQLITTQQQPLDLNETDYISKQGAYLLPRFKKSSFVIRKWFLIKLGIILENDVSKKLDFGNLHKAQQFPLCRY